MQHRRDFLKQTMATAAGLGILGDGVRLDAARAEVGEHRSLEPADVLDMEKMKPRGHTYESTIPDTFDLADRARMAIIALTHLVAPDTWSGP